MHYVHRELEQDHRLYDSSHPSRYLKVNLALASATLVIFPATGSQRNILRPDRDALRETMAMVKHSPGKARQADQLTFEERQRLLQMDPRTIIGFERCAGIFPHRNPPARILYFPNGTYWVSSTIWLIY